MKRTIGFVLVVGTVAMFMWNSGPRLLSDFRHAREFTPAQHFKVTDYRCTNWNGFVFNECTTSFVSQSGESRQITDYRFGRAPRDPARLMQWRDNVSSVTTDVSLRTLWNRLSVAVMLILFVALATIGLAVRALKTDAAPSGDPAPQPAGRPRIP